MTCRVSSFIMMKECVLWRVEERFNLVTQDWGTNVGHFTRVIEASSEESFVDSGKTAKLLNRPNRNSLSVAVIK
jgi:hypothetical protein